MPRHVKSKPTLGPKAVRHGRPKGDGWRKVSRVSVETAALIEIGADDAAWREGSPEDLDIAQDRDCPGAIVKLAPPPGTAESLVLAMERSFYVGGAKSVKVMPTQEEVVIAIDDVGEFKRPDMSDNRSLRQVAMERVDRATNSHDQDALRALVAQAMDHAEAQA